MIWTREGYVCPHCGASDPDGGDKCGNCDEHVFDSLPPDEQLTEAQKLTYDAVLTGGLIII